jgi:hypothetical protein
MLPPAGKLAQKSARVFTIIFPEGGIFHDLSELLDFYF